MPNKYGVETGRIMPRVKYVCESCKVRRALGAPHAIDTWPARLRLTQEVMDLLLVAGAEFDELTAASGTDCGAVDFVDWVAPEALREDDNTPANVSAERTMDRHKALA